MPAGKGHSAGLDIAHEEQEEEGHQTLKELVPIEPFVAAEHRAFAWWHIRRASILALRRASQGILLVGEESQEKHETDYQGQKHGKEEQQIKGRRELLDVEEAALRENAGDL